MAQSQDMTALCFLLASLFLLAGEWHDLIWTWWAMAAAIKFCYVEQWVTDSVNNAAYRVLGIVMYTFLLYKLMNMHVVSPSLYVALFMTELAFSQGNARLRSLPIKLLEDIRKGKTTFKTVRDLVDHILFFLGLTICFWYVATSLVWKVLLVISVPCLIMCMGM